MSFEGRWTARQPYNTAGPSRQHAVGSRDSGWPATGRLRANDATTNGIRQSSRPSSGVETGQVGMLVCDHRSEDRRCGWRTNNALSLQLHRADRHLIFPAGGKEELARIDPLLEEERKEEQRRARRRGTDEDAEHRANALIVGLNINLDTPELIEKWLAERRKRWPTRAVIKQKELTSWDHPVRSQRQPTSATQLKNFEADDDASSSSESSSDAGVRQKNAEGRAEEGRPEDEEASSGSDMDEEKDAISSKIVPALPLPPSDDNKRFCRFFQKGTCRNGAQCSHLHEIDPRPASSDVQKKRKRPRATSPNPFEAPNLLRALLHREIANHVNYVAQVVRFLVKNDFLLDFEQEVGQAEAQLQRRSKIIEVGKKDDVLDMKLTGIKAPITAGALPIVDKSLFAPQSPLLKPLEGLMLPPEPDEFALMDPLRVNDARSLTHEQCRHVAQDIGIRTLLLDESIPVDKHDRRSKGLMRALTTLDALPTYNHQSSALEQILGVSQQSATHAHQLGPTFVRADRQAGGPGTGRLIGEQELFRLGLRVGPLEMIRIRQIASRLSSLLGGPSFNDAAADAYTDPIKPWFDAEQRQAARVRQWHKEGEWRDQMRKLGIDVD